MRIVLLRHGATEWSESKRHTGRTDIPLIDAGRAAARRAGERLADHTFAHVYCSPLSRAQETATLAGFGDRLELVDDLMEWDYGDYEGITTKEIHASRPGWLLWDDGVPNGEAVADVTARTSRVWEHVGAQPEGEDILLVAHGHILRALASSFVLGGDITLGRSLALDTAAICELGYERTIPAIWHWNT